MSQSASSIKENLLLAKLREMRDFGGQIDTVGLADGIIDRFLANHGDLGTAIERAFAAFTDLKSRDPGFLALDEADQVEKAQAGFTNFYDVKAVNPYVAAAGAGPWIVTVKGAVDGWITAISLDGRGVTDYAKYVFQPLIDDPKTGNKVGLKIRGTRKDSSGTDVTLQGPLEDDLTANVSDTIPNATGKFFKLAGQTGKVNVTVKCQEADFHYAVIKLK